MERPTYKPRLRPVYRLLIAIALFATGGVMSGYGLSVGHREWKAHQPAALGVPVSTLTTSAASTALVVDRPLRVSGVGGGVDGRFMSVRNTGPGMVTMSNEDSSAPTVERLNTPGGYDVAIAPGGMIWIRFDGARQRWLVVAAQ